MTLKKDHAYYMKVNGREWVIWITPDGSWRGIPGDEKPFSETDLTKLAHYLQLEGWLDENYEPVLAEV
jgi:hypothetical protein